MTTNQMLSPHRSGLPTKLTISPQWLYADTQWLPEFTRAKRHGVSGFRSVEQPELGVLFPDAFFVVGSGLLCEFFFDGLQERTLGEFVFASIEDT